MKKKKIRSILALVLSLCLLLSGGVLAEETVEALVAATEFPETTEEIAEEISVAAEAAEEAAPVVLTPLTAAEILPGEGWAQDENDALIIPYAEKITFNWTPVEGAVSYRIETAHISEEGTAEDIREVGVTEEVRIALPAADYADGWYAIGIVAQAEDGRSSLSRRVFRIQEEIAEEINVSDDEEVAEEIAVSSNATALIITSYPQSVTVAEGEKATVTVEAEGDGLSYVWYAKEAGESSYYKSSITSNTYSVVMNESRNGRRLICYVSDKYGNKIQCPTVMIKMSEGNPLTIVSYPQSVTVAEGEKATVTVEATGDGLSYTWYTREAGSDTYYKSSISGNTYSVVMNESRNGRRLICYVSDKYGNKIQCPTVMIKMKAANPLTIVSYPKNVTVAEGQKATVTVEATGDGLSYTWYTREADSDTYYKSSISGNTYSVVMNEARHGRRLICYVSDQYGNKIQCPTVMIKMGTKLEITRQPQSVTVSNGEKASVQVVAKGDGLTYAWYASDVGDNGVYYQSASITGDTYSVVMNDTRAGRKVYCVVGDAYGQTVKSDIATLNRSSALEIIAYPKSVTVNAGQKATVTVEARGEGLKYEWYTREAGSDTYYKSSISGNTYSVEMNEARNGRRLICYVSDQYGNKIQCPTVLIRMLSAETPVVAFAYPGGGQLKLSWTSVENAQGYILMGAKYPDEPVELVRVSGCEHTFSGLNENHMYVFYVVPYANDGNSRGTVGMINACTANLEHPRITGVSCTGENEAEIRWETHELAGSYHIRRSTKDTFPDGLTTTYTVEPQDGQEAVFTNSGLEAGKTYYYCMNAIYDLENISGYCIDGYGETYAYTHPVPLTIVTQPQDVTVPEGEEATVTVEATGDGLEYAWYIRNATAANFSKSSITDSSYSVNMDSSRDGRQLYCIVSDKYGSSVQSNTVTMHMAAELQITQHPAGVSGLEGATATLSVQAEGEGLNYEWFIRKTAGGQFESTGCTESEYSLSLTLEHHQNYVYCLVTDAFGNQLQSAYAQLKVLGGSRPVLSAEYYSDTYMLFKWDTVGNASGYYFYASEDGGQTYTLIKDLPYGTSALSYIKGLTLEYVYYFKMQAYYNNGEILGVESSPIVVYNGSCTAPEITDVECMNSMAAKVKWNAVKNASAYYLYRTSENGSVNVNYPTANVSGSFTEYTDYGISTGTYKYAIAVAIKGANGVIRYPTSHSDYYKYSHKPGDGVVTYRALLMANNYQGCGEEWELFGKGNCPPAYAKMLARYSGSDYQITQKINQTSTQILNNIPDTFGDADWDDVSLLFFGGHGNDGGNIHGYDLKRVSVSSLREKLDEIPGKKIVILECCHSGVFINKSAEKDASLSSCQGFNDAVVSAFSAVSRDTLAANNYVVLTACAGDEKSYTCSSSYNEETGEEKGYGAMTYSIAKVCGYDMIEKANCTISADADSNGKITLGECFDEASVVARELMESKGYPMNMQYYGDRSFVLWKQ